MIDRERFKGKLLDYNIVLTETQLTQLELYSEFLVEYNEKVNLTAITQSEGIEDKHFIDSLLFARIPLVTGSLVDVGTGAGFPGIVAKIYNPAINLTLLEPTGKRCLFLELACEKLGIEATVVKERAEEAGKKKYRESFDVATARAVADLKVLAEYSIPLVKKGGFFIPMKAEMTTEITSSKQAISKLGCKEKDVINYSLPDGSKRTILIFEKIHATPSQYPRNGSNINKKPL